MAVTNDERRRVAERLRERAGRRVLNLCELLWCIGCDDGDDAAAWNCLADLIEPSAPKVKCVAEVKVDGEQLEKLAHDAAVELTGIDRDALLALAEDVDGAADDSGGFEPMAGMLRDIARSIREACGVVA